VTSDEQRRADALDRLIDGAAAGTAGGDLDPLIALAAEFRSALAPAPAAGAVRARVLARVTNRVAASQAAPRLGRRTILRPAYALAGLLLVLTLTFGATAAYASEAALPGDVLYGVKRGLEDVRLVLSTTAAGDSTLVEHFADRRLDEIEALTGRGRWDDAERALQAYPEVVDELVALSQAGAVDSQAARLAHHLEVLLRVAEKTPAEAQPALLRALERADRGRQEVERRRQDSKPIPPGQRDAQDDSDRGPRKTLPGQERKDQGGD